MAQASSYGLLKSSIGKKVVMALTGLFLCLFLVGHLAGNLQLLQGDSGQLGFNAYAKFMTTNPLVKVLSYLTYLSVLFHVIDGIVLTMKNKQARPANYHYRNSSVNSSWSSQNMAVLGMLILIFLVVHLANFWYKMHFGDIPTDSAGNKDLYTVVKVAFSELWYVLLYVACMIGLGFHLWHGFASGFQSLGINHPAYTPVIKALGKGFAVIVSALFALIPVVFYLVHS